jgi:hypothetical protein
MSWIAITDLSHPDFNIRGIGVQPDAPDARPPMTHDELLSIGTLLIETSFQAEPGKVQNIVSYRRDRGWRRGLAVRLSHGGALTVAVRQGVARSVTTLRFPAPPRDSRIRISYSWHGPMRTGRLTVKVPDLSQIYQVEVRDPVPLPAIDIRVLIRNGNATEIGPETRFVAVSDAIEPVWLRSGVAAGTPVETVDGPVPVERLRLGDLVQTAASGLQPVRWVSSRTVPALGGFRPVRLRAPFFGLEQDILVAPDHRIRLGDVESAYMLGEDEVLLEAGHLVNGRAAQHDGKSPLVTYYQVLLDMHDCLLHCGLWAESLFIPRQARDPAIVKSSTLADMSPAAIPVHRGFARRTLADYEARTLAAAIHA